MDQNLEELQLLNSKEIGTHRTEKEKKNMLQFEKFVADRIEKADELAMAGVMIHEEVQKRLSRNEERCTQPCSTQPAFTAWWRTVGIGA